MQIIIRLGLTLLVAMLATACGGHSVEKKKTDTTENGSRTENPSLGPSALYNGFADSLSVLKGYTTYQSNLPINSSTQIQVRLSSTYSSVFSNSTRILKFYKWGEGIAIDPANAVQFFLYDSITFSGLNYKNSSGNYVLLINQLNDEMIQNVIANNALGGTTVDNFFSRVFIVLTDMDLRWDAVTAALYDTSTGNTALSSVDFLIPPFYANPTTYSNTRQSSAQKDTLIHLHPNYSRINDGLSDEAYLAFTKDFCQGFWAANPSQCL